MNSAITVQTSQVMQVLIAGILFAGCLVYFRRRRTGIGFALLLGGTGQLIVAAALFVLLSLINNGRLGGQTVELWISVIQIASVLASGLFAAAFLILALATQQSAQQSPDAVGGKPSAA